LVPHDSTKENPSAPQVDLSATSQFETKREEKELFKRRAKQPFSRFHITLIDWRRRERKEK
jgi:hypothetical protein